MSHFRKVFPTGKVFLAVIHAESHEQALRNARVALENGAHGLFLIGHGIPSHKLTSIYDYVRGAHPEAWIGLNYLDEMSAGLIGLQPRTASGLWVNDGLIHLKAPKPTQLAAIQWRIIQGERGRHSPKDFLYFGGVHFKGWDQESDPAEAARLAHPLMDVVTTSGPGTGQAADPKKIELMKKAMGEEGILGLASGCTPENVGDYPGADVFLVATGVSSSFTELSPEKVCRFAAACR